MAANLNLPKVKNAVPNFKPEIRLCHAKLPSSKCTSQSDEQEILFGTRSYVHECQRVAVEHVEKFQVSRQLQ